MYLAFRVIGSFRSHIASLKFVAILPRQKLVVIKVTVGNVIGLIESNIDTYLN